MEPKPLDKLGIFQTIHVLTLALLIAFLIFGSRWLLWAAVFLAVANTFENRLTTAIAKGWLAFAQWIGRINSRILLTLIFFLFLTPIAWLYRLFNRTLVDHFRADTRTSTFQERNHRWEPADFEKIW
ncbi:MAG: hypothetical protein HPY65_03245 [Syntrophaceae bacterium]|nr:hypothetical protein [Syntrophaceae bacterium]